MEARNIDFFSGHQEFHTITWRETLYGRIQRGPGIYHFIRFFIFDDSTGIGEIWRGERNEDDTTTVRSVSIVFSGEAGDEEKQGRESVLMMYIYRDEMWYPVVGIVVYHSNLI